MAIEKRTYATSEEAKAVMDELLSQGFADVKASFKPDRVLVAVNAAFGEGQRATQILDRYQSIAPDDEGSADEAATSAPAPRNLDWAKIANSATPLSDFFGWSVLKDYRSPVWPKALVDDPTPLSNKFGWSVLYGASGGTDPRRAGDRLSAPIDRTAAAAPAEAAHEAAQAPVEQSSGTGAAAQDEGGPAQIEQPAARKRPRRSPRGQGKS